MVAEELLNLVSCCAHRVFGERRNQRRLEFLLKGFIEGRGLGVLLHAPLDVVLGERDVVQPDIMFISKERFGIISEEEIRGAPDLIVEIVAPATERRDKTYKKTLYARHGVKEYWIVDPVREEVEIYRLGEMGFEEFGVYKRWDKIGSPLLPGLEIGLSYVFS